MTTSSRSPAPLAFITGASSGIGQALAWHAYQQGWSLALVARRGDVMAQWAAQQGLDSSRFALYEADVGVPDSIIAAARRCEQQQGLPDVVIANAGVSWGVDTSMREDIDTMQQVLAVNTMGVVASFHPLHRTHGAAWKRATGRNFQCGRAARPARTRRLLRQQSCSHCLLRKPSR